MRSSPFAPLEELIAPAPAPARVAFLKGRPFAHRGLHGGRVVENSRAAFAAAVAAGHGIELDVQASREGTAIVFHDATLDRLTGRPGALADMSAAELAKSVLSGTGEGIAPLDEIVKLVGGRVPVLIEVKTRGRHVAALCLSVRRALEGYRGDAAVMSFNPQVARWFATHAPRIVRGLVISEEGKRGVRGWAERWLSLWRARPDFLAYDMRDLPSRFAAAARARGLPVLTWTVRDAESEARAFAHADEVIYEKTA
ncbi:MAG: glycerophosphodiester phosphodiesterase [Sphingomonadaceae bacterium]|nr:glycerophosphodiester phosphodiesterase [Sphingomonadaceae bacterium]